jgi:hypothetical protein
MADVARGETVQLVVAQCGRRGHEMAGISGRRSWVPSARCEEAMSCRRYEATPSGAAMFGEEKNRRCLRGHYACTENCLQ